MERSRINLGKAAPELYQVIGKLGSLLSAYAQSAGIVNGFSHLLRRASQLNQYAFCCTSSRAGCAGERQVQRSYRCINCMAWKPVLYSRETGDIGFYWSSYYDWRRLSSRSGLLRCCGSAFRKTDGCCWMDWCCHPPTGGIELLFQAYPVKPG